jgi:hypothetical protein
MRGRGGGLRRVERRHPARKAVAILDRRLQLFTGQSCRCEGVPQGRPLMIWLLFSVFRFPLAAFPI